MIQETTTHVCRVCKSTHIVKNGTNRCGNAQYHCKDCGAYRVLKPTQVYSETEEQRVLRAFLERCSLRGIARIFAMARQTIARWLREHTENSTGTPKWNEQAVSKKPFENSEIFHDNSEKSERFQRKSEKSKCLFYTLIRLFQRRLFDCIVTEPTKKGPFENGWPM